MRWIWGSALVVASACSFEPGRLGSDGPVDPDADLTDAMLGDPQQWTFDTAAELGADGSRIDSPLTIEEPGALTQVGYTYGALLMFGKQGEQLWTLAMPTAEFAATANVTPDGVSLWGTELLDLTTDLDRSGVIDNGDFTIWFEGEALLDAGDIVSLEANDVGFVELELPTGWAHIESRSDGVQALAAVTTAGWYRIRAGWSESSSDGAFSLTRGPSGTPVRFSRDRLRAPTSTLRGVMRDVYYRQIFGGASDDSRSSIVALETTPLFTQTAFAQQPLGAGGDTDWSARWYGQFYAAIAGSYSVRATTDDGNQLSLAGTQARTSWSRNAGNANAVTTVTADLAIGWHDIALDYNQVGGGMAANLVVTAAPETALVNAPIPIERLRPVEPRRDRLVNRTRKFAQVTVPNNNLDGGPSRTFTFAGLPNETVTAIDFNVRVQTDHLDQLVFRITPPGGTPIVVSNHPAGGSFDSFFQAHLTTTGIVGQPLDGAWTVQVSDDTGGANSTNIREIALTMHTGAGPGQVAPDAAWTSPVRDAGKGPVFITDVAWVERAAIASELFLRACITADCSDDPAWGTAMPMHGTVQLPTQYIQAKLVLHTDGTTESVLDSLAITYRN